MVKDVTRSGLILAMLILIIDQISKWIILAYVDLPAVRSIEVTSFFNLTMVWNKGISMGFLAGEGEFSRWALTVGTMLVTVWLFFWLKQSSRRLEALALGAVMGGAIGNIVDRVLHGAVADFLHFHYGGYSFYVFNVADAAISIGVIFLLIDGLRDAAKSPTKG